MPRPSRTYRARRWSWTGLLRVVIRWVCHYRERVNSSQWMTVVLIWLTTYRLTILVTDDKLTRPIVDPIQEWFERRWLAKHPDGDTNSDQWQSYLAFALGCAWCVSVYFGAAVTVVVDLWIQSVPLPALVAITASGVTGFLASVVDHD